MKGFGRMLSMHSKDEAMVHTIMLIEGQGPGMEVADGFFGPFVVKN
jgi:hypothetical protein